MTDTKVAVILTGTASERSTPGEVNIQSWNDRERLMRALKFWGYCWGGAILAVFLPLVHFVAVPSLLIAGPILFFVFLRQNSVVLGGQGTCPDCGKPFQIVRCANRFPMSDLCTQCQRSVKISLKD